MQARLIHWLAVYFNPRTHKECDFISVANLANFLAFQSTHSQRVRQHHKDNGFVPSKFQSTHSQRVRRILYFYKSKTTLFQSTHSQRVRPSDYLNDSSIKLISIHALTKSATGIFINHKKTHIIFQSTHSQRVRPQYLDHDFNSFLNIGLQINLP